MSAGGGSATFRIGQARDPDWRKAAANCLAQIGAPDGQANIGWLYFSDHFADVTEAILEAFRKATHIEDWFGCAAIGVCATGHEYFDQPAIVALVGRLPEGSYRFFASAEGGVDGFVQREDGWLSQQLGCFGVVHGDPGDGGALAAMPQLAEACEGFFVGGITASRGRHPQIAGRIHEGGLTAMLLSGEVGVATGLTQGCSPIGTAHEVTAAEGNVLFELDGRPALEVFKQDIGEVLARDLRRVSGYIFAALPVRGADWGDYLVRNLTGIDEQHGALAIGDDLSEAGQIMFCRRDRGTAQADMRRMLTDLTGRLDGPPRAALYHTCLARGANMFEAENAELGLIAEHLGDIPLVGFFGNGEISHNRLYAYTGVLSVFT